MIHVTWEALLSDGVKHVGFTDDGSWKKLPSYLNETNLKIVGLRIYNVVGESDIDANADGYFIGNKSIVEVSCGCQLNMVGIGYWKEGNPVRIKWHRSDTLELLEVETRTIEESGFFFVRNPK